MHEGFPFSSYMVSLLLMVSMLCIAAQSAAFLVRANRYKLASVRWAEGLTEGFVLLHIVMLSTMISQIDTDRIRPLVMESGYIYLRYGVFTALIILSLITCLLRRSAAPLSIVAAAILTLPFGERYFDRTFFWTHLLVLLYWMGRAIYIYIRRSQMVKREVSALSIKEAIDTLHSGLLYYRASDGLVYLANRRMEYLMTALTGAIQRNGKMFLQALQSGDTRLKAESALLDGQLVFRLDDDTVWLFRENSLTISRHTYAQISAVDVTERWRLTRELWQRERELSQRGEKLAVTLENLEATCRDEQILRMQSRVHDSMAQRLAMLMRILRSEQDANDVNLSDFAEDILSAAREDAAVEFDPQGIAALRWAYADIGVSIDIRGAVPERRDIIAFYFDFVREGVANAVRHGFASEVVVTCNIAENEILISLANNGVIPAGNITEGGGIKELRRRLNELGGVLSIAVQPQFKLTALIFDLAE